MNSTAPATSPRAILNCHNCNAVTRIIDLEGEAARAAYVLGGVWTHCPVCSWRVMADAVRGTYSAKKKCGAACMGARRGDCECSCAGENHGLAH